MNILDKFELSDIDKEMDVISSNSHFVGNFTFGDLARIEGKLDGSIDSYGLLVIGERSEINADISGETVVINGKIIGNISANKLIVVEENGLVSGDVTAPGIIIRNGGKINGQISMSKHHKKINEI